MPHFQRGVENYNKGNYDIAILEFTRAINKEPQKVKAYIYRGNAYQILGKFHAAVINFSQAIQLEPTNITALNNRAVAHQKLHNYIDAVADYTKAIELNPTDAAAYNNRGVLNYELKQYDEALADCSRAIELKPTDAKAFYNRGNANKKLKRGKQAEEDYSKAIELNPDFEFAYYQRAEDAIDRQYGKAIEDLTKVIDLQPKNSSAYNRRARVYCKLRQFKDAEKDYLYALKLYPSHMLYTFNLAKCYIQSGEKLKAKIELQKAIKEFKRGTVTTLRQKFGIDEDSVGLLEELILNYQKRKQDIEQLIKEAKLQKNHQVLAKLNILAEMNVKSLINDAPDTYIEKHESGDRFSVRSESRQQIDQTEDELQNCKAELRRNDEVYESTPKLNKEILAGETPTMTSGEANNMIKSEDREGANRFNRKKMGCCGGAECLIY